MAHSRLGKGQEAQQQIGEGAEGKAEDQARSTEHKQNTGKGIRMALRGHRS